MTDTVFVLATAEYLEVVTELPPRKRPNRPHHSGNQPSEWWDEVAKLIQSVKGQWVQLPERFNVNYQSNAKILLEKRFWPVEVATRNGRLYAREGAE